MFDVDNFDELRIGLATADDIRHWSRDEVRKPETINYHTLKPEKDGLFYERIFGPTCDWECACGKYKYVRFRGTICEHYGVEVIKSKVRRERMGRVELAIPIAHIWYFKGVPSHLGYLLNLAPKDLEKIIYFTTNIITSVDKEVRHNDQETLEADILMNKRLVEDDRDQGLAERTQTLERDLAKLEATGAKADARKRVQSVAECEMHHIRGRTQRELGHLGEVWSTFIKFEPKQMITDEGIYTELVDRYENYFTGGIGAKVIQTLIRSFDLTREAKELHKIIRDDKEQKRMRTLKRLKVVTVLLQSGNGPTTMVLDCIPVVPPELRPMVQLDGGRFATSGLNDLYCRAINRNNRLKRMIDLGAPEIIVDNERRMLQESADALFDDRRRSRPVAGPGNRPLKSLSGPLRGKQDHFHQNLLGKRADYSGRSAIIAGPQLKLRQCGSPKLMALELSKPFVIRELVAKNYAQGIKSTKRMVERQRPEVWDVLEDVIAGHPVLLNHAPTLHRLGIQTFEPVLIEGKATQLHPLACEAFNADFDSDQMAIHLPLSAEAQAETRVLMLSSNNILPPTSGEPLAMSRLDVVTGLYFLALEKPELPGGRQDTTKDVPEQGIYTSPAGAIIAYDRGAIGLQNPIKVRISHLRPPAGTESEQFPDGWNKGDTWLASIALGRVMFNDLLPWSYPYVEDVMAKKPQAAIINDLTVKYPMITVAQTVDKLKDASFYWATHSGVTIAMSDVLVLPNKRKILNGYEEKATMVRKKFRRNKPSAAERHESLVSLWKAVTAGVGEKVEALYSDDNPIPMIVKLGIVGGMDRIHSLADMKGIIMDLRGKCITRPIKASFREGLSVLEYFNNSHGSHKGLVDAALRTADSGYLTRRLVDVAQDVIVREEDCSTHDDIVVGIGEDILDTTGNPTGEVRRTKYVRIAVIVRVLAADVTGAEGNALVEAGTDLNGDRITLAPNHGIREVKVRSVLTCSTVTGVCVKCYGRSMATDRLVDIRGAVDIIAAQSTDGPDTQLTVRTFHRGDVDDDITGGLPRVQGLFEARMPKNKAPLVRENSRVRLEEDGHFYTLTLIPDANSEGEVVYNKLSKRQGLTEIAIDGHRRATRDGDHVVKGQQLPKGVADSHEVLEVLGRRSVQCHLIEKVQSVYCDQGVATHDKHIEVIVGQMLRCVIASKPGDSDLLPGVLVERSTIMAKNRETVASGGNVIEGRCVLMGITKASLTTEPWLSTASSQKTTRVLTDAAINKRSGKLISLKENVITGKLTPAGTDISRYRNITVGPIEEAAHQAAAPFVSFGKGFYGAEGTYGIGQVDSAVPLGDIGTFE